MKRLGFIFLMLLAFSCSDYEREYIKTEGLNVCSADINRSNRDEIYGNKAALISNIYIKAPQNPVPKKSSIIIAKSQINSMIKDFKNGLLHLNPNSTEIMLRPLIDFGNIYRGDLTFVSDSGWAKFEHSYRNLILRIAQLSKNYKFHSICIGTEWRCFVQKRQAFWDRLITELKRTYPDLKLTYAANWDDYDKIPFWSEMEYIGIDGYFPLVKSKTPSINELIEAYTQIKRKLKSYSFLNFKKVVFMEYGFRSIDHNAWKQWKLPGPYCSDNYNFTAQKNCFEAFFKTFWNEKWVKGGYLWYWDLKLKKLPTSPFYLNHWEPNYKPAEKVIRDWYKE